MGADQAEGEGMKFSKLSTANQIEGKVLKGFEAPKLDRAIDRAATARLKKGR